MWKKRTRVNFLPQTSWSDSWRLLYFIISTLFSLAEPLNCFSISWLFFQTCDLFCQFPTSSWKTQPTSSWKCCTENNTVFQVRICQHEINRKNYFFFPTLLWFTHLIKVFAFSHQYERVNTSSLWVTVMQLHLSSSAAQTVTTQTIPVVFLPKHKVSHLPWCLALGFFRTTFPTVK